MMLRALEEERGVGDDDAVVLDGEADAVAGQREAGVLDAAAQALARLLLRGRVVVEPADGRLGGAHRVDGGELVRLPGAQHEPLRLDPAQGWRQRELHHDLGPVAPGGGEARARVERSRRERVLHDREVQNVERAHVGPGDGGVEQPPSGAAAVLGRHPRAP